jgi:endonuclease YncB( thermonuclease family)
LNFIIKLNKLLNNKQQTTKNNKQMRIMNFNAIFSCMNILSNKNKNITNSDITNNNLNNLKIIPSSLEDVKNTNKDTNINANKDTDVPPPIIEWKDTVPFTFPIANGQVIKVYDGDTITIASKLPYDASPLYRLSVRLNGIDTPEIKGKNDDEKEAAKAARNALSNLIYGKQIRLENIKSEKYGRILADVYLNQLHINDWLIRERYAVAYDGGTKKSPESWIKYRETREI